MIEGTYTESEAKAELETFKGVRRIQVSLVLNSQCQDWEAFSAKYTNLWAGKEVLETMVKSFTKETKKKRGDISDDESDGGSKPVPPVILSHLKQANAWLNRMQRNPSPMDQLPTHTATVRIEEEEFHPKWYVMNASLDSMIDIPVTNYTIIFLDCQYELDTEKASSKTDKALTPKLLETFIENVKSVTTATHWSLIIFCGFKQQNDFLEVCEKSCSLGASRFFWKRERNPNHMQNYVNTKERLNNIEAGLVAYHCNREKGDPTGGRQDWQVNSESLVRK